MSIDSNSFSEEKSIFRPFTRESLQAIEQRIAEEHARQKELERKRAEGQIRYEEEDIDEGPQPDPILEQGVPLPVRLHNQFPAELVSVPLEDIDPYYHNQRTFVVISKGKDIFRFSATNALWALDPFNPIRRVAINVLVHPLFSIIIIMTILTNCVLMAVTPNPTIESTEVIFTSIYTFESAIKVMARGFILENFTYLRDAWNWLDFVVITLAYFTMGIELGNLAVLRTFRVLRALKTVAIVPGLKTIVGAVIESVKNLRDVIILTMFSLSVFALMGLQLYMGVLTQKCILRFPEDGSYGNLTEESWFKFCSNESNWYGEYNNYQLCGNASGAGTCPPEYVCLAGFGNNPNYGYTNFDTFGWALLSAFRLMTQDYWENLYQQVLRVMGPYHMVFFIIIIFLGSFYLVNLILAIVAMSYDELQKKAEEEEAAEEEAIRQAEEAAQEREQKKSAHESRVAERAEKAAAAAAAVATADLEPNNYRTGSVTKSPSEYSCHSYELYIGQEKGNVDDNKEKMSIRSDTLSQGKQSLQSNKIRKVSATSLSLPGSPFNIRRASKSSHQFTIRSSRPRFPAASDTRPLVLNTLFDAQDHLPYADDSTAVTPLSEENGVTILPSYYINLNTRHNSYTSHTSRISYTSHSDLFKQSYVPTKESQLRSRSQKYNFSSDYKITSKEYDVSYKEKEEFMSTDKPKYSRSSEQQPLVDLKDVMVLSDIIEQAAGRQTDESDIQISTTYYFPTEDNEDEPTAKERMLVLCMRGIDFFCVWDCCWVWLEIQKVISLVVFDPFTELFITLCIVVNTLFMALDHYDMDKDLDKLLKTGNYFFSGTFAFEATLKLMAMSPKFYFQVGWNIFDFIIVVLSLVEFSLEGVQGLSVLRSFRLLRVFKLAKSWPTLNLLISIMGRTIGALGNLTFVLCIIIFIFAVMGMQLFGKNYIDNVHFFPDAKLPRWNFTDFMHSFMIVFRVLCGEWIESMWDCLLVGDGDISCIPFFLATVVIGNLVVLNLFLALLLSNFGSSNLSAPTADSDTSKIVEAFDRIGRFINWIKMSIFKCLKAIKTKVTNQISAQQAPTEPCINYNWNQVIKERDMDYNVTNNDILADDILYSDKKDQPEVTIGEGMEFTIHGDIRSRLKGRRSIVCNNIGNHKDNRSDIEYIKNKYEHDNISTKSYGSHIHRSYKNESHKGSYEGNVDGEEKKDISKEDVGYELDECEAKEALITPTEKLNPNLNGIALEQNSEEMMEHPEDCFSDDCYRRFPFLSGDEESPFWQGWANLRLKTYRLIENKYFETAVITMILLSSLALALEDVHLQSRPILQDILYYMDRIFTVIFFIEMLIKWLALGFRKYFTNAWCWLDFIIVMLSLINLAAIWLGAADIPAFRSMRTLRALRPLRAVSRWEGMRVSLINFVASMCGASGIQAFKTMRTLRALRPLRAMARMQGMRVVVNALVQAIPSIFNVLLVCLIFWLIFAIMGVQLFAGKYHKCEDENGEKLDHEIVPDKTTCLRENYTWQNSPMNFDHVGKAYLCLFQVATFKGWIPIMNDAIDSRELHKQPIYEINIYMYLYFVFFIIFGSFFTLNLFIGVIIDNFNEQKKKAGGSLEMFMTEDQKKYYNAMKKMGSKKPLKAIPRPKWKPQAIAFEICTNKKFDMIIMLFIGLNMLTMTMDRYRPSKMLGDTLELLNTIFIVIFSTECLLKIFALRYHYFKEPWNLFDFVVVILSIVGLVLSDIIAKYFVSPTLLRVVRVAKVGRVLRLVKGAKGIRTLLFALAMSLPALFNICLLLFLVMFIFAIFGMSFFMHVKNKSGIDDVYNFKTFGQSFILLFMMSTSAGWDGVLDGIINEEDCDLPDMEMGSPGSCGNATMGITFLLSYLVISFLIVINMYIAVILENYSQATEDVQEGLTDDDYDMYYEIWQQFDPDGTQYIRYDQLSDFLDILEHPLQIHKPNKYKIVSMDIPICKGNRMFCVDILDALTKDFFARKGNPIEETAEIGEIQTRPDEVDYEPISSTLWRQREEYCTRVIQNAYRKYVTSRSKCENNEEDENANANSAEGRDTAILVESDGYMTKNGHKVVIHSRSSSNDSGLNQAEV